MQMAESGQNQKNIGKKKQRVLAGHPPSKESRNIVVLFLVFFGFVFSSKVFNKCSVGYFKEIGMNHRQSCQSAFGSAVKHLKISS
jgi:hypothetical protein